tara:strand:- start:244 stop:369 length:126 start_codon:yes stop_codon:yes gene_type:complete
VYPLTYVSAEATPPIANAAGKANKAEANKAEKAFILTVLEK